MTELLHKNNWMNKTLTKVFKVSDSQTFPEISLFRWKFIREHDPNSDANGDRGWEPKTCVNLNLIKTFPNILRTS